MSIQHLVQKAQKTLTKHQRSQLTNLKPKKKITKGYMWYKEKYWCPVEKDDYLATDKHIHCKLCYKPEKGDKHEIIKFEDRKK